jgi:hypothetical protein
MGARFVRKTRPRTIIVNVLGECHVHYASKTTFVDFEKSKLVVAITHYTLPNSLYVGSEVVVVITHYTLHNSLYVCSEVVVPIPHFYIFFYKLLNFFSL